jgi:hypothetical protein
MTDQEAFQWRHRLLAERDLKNLTDLHVRILLDAHWRLDQGETEWSHAAVADAQKVAVRTVGDAYRRARLLGLLDWEAQFRDVQGVRRRAVNRYRLVMPEREAVERHAEVRRKRKPIFLSSLPTCSVDVAEPSRSVPLHLITLRMEERIARRWAAGQRF